MTGKTRRAAIVGVYATEQARGMERSNWSLELEAIKGALAEAGLSHTQVDGLIPMDYDTPISLHMAWTEQLGGHPITYMSIGNASGGVAKAASAIETGLANVVVIYFGNANNPNGPRQLKMLDRAPRVKDWMFLVHGAYMSVWYAMWTQLYLHEFKANRDYFAEYPCKMRDNAILKPGSLMGSKGPITIEDVYASRMIASPLHLFECSLDNDGGYAIVVAAEDIAKDCKTTPIWVLGGSEAMYTDGYQTITAPWNNPEGAAVKRATEIAFGMAGITHDDIDVAGLYDCFAITVARNLEEMGFCKLGEGADYMHEGHLWLDGKMPSNTDGGLMSNSHNGNPSGMHTIEVVRQLRGECGARQVKDPKIGVTLAQGASVHGLAGVTVLARD